MKTGNLYIISAPSGAGKTSLVKQLIKQLDHINVSVSHTTRAIRTGETEAKDYFFTSMVSFKQMIDDHLFLEHAQVFDNFYGTSRQTVDNMLQTGTDVVLEIDWQGATQIKRLLPDSISIFILPPSIIELQQRLEKRAQDSAEIIARRMQDAVVETSHCHDFDYLIVNDDFEIALHQLMSIITCHRLKKSKQLIHLTQLITELS